MVRVCDIMCTCVYWQVFVLIRAADKDFPNESQSFYKKSGLPFYVRNWYTFSIFYIYFLHLILVFKWHFVHLLIKSNKMKSLINILFYLEIVSFNNQEKSERTLKIFFTTKTFDDQRFYSILHKNFIRLQ